MVPRLSKTMCFPASLSPAEALCWSLYGCRIRPKDEKVGKMLVPFILVRDDRLAASCLGEKELDVFSPFSSPWLP